VRRIAALLAALAVGLTACGGGGGGDAQDVLADTSANLGEIKSGDLNMELLFSSKDDERAGFTLQGPFALRPGELPEAQLDYTQLAGPRSATQTFITKGDIAYVRIDGTTYELPQETADEIGSTLGTSGGLAAIDLSTWVENPSLEDGEEIGGDETDRITADLNVSATVNTLMAIASQLGGTEPLAALTGPSAQQVQNAIESASIDVWTGQDDRLLRRLKVAIDFAPAAEKVENLLGAGIDFTLEISNPNEPVTVETPTDAQPFSR
jgi:hypothetical protein